MARKSSALSVSRTSIDPALDALFSASSGPVKAPSKSRYSSGHPANVPRPAVATVVRHQTEPLDGDEGNSSGGETEEGGKASIAAETPADIEPQILGNAQDEQNIAEKLLRRRGHKRKRQDKGDDLEFKYLQKLTGSEQDQEPASKRRMEEEHTIQGSEKPLDNSDVDDGYIPQHESVALPSGSSDLERASRTVFLANVSNKAINSKAAKKTLLAHLSTPLNRSVSPPEKLESLRFRSVAFADAALPKRAAYITGSLMDATTQSANAYVVYSTTAAARKAIAELNGTEVLGRHLRADSVAHPSPIDHKRCVFVGNLGFVDDEMVLNTDADGNTTQKKRNKVPSDVEEGLWRTFGKHAGKVENVRVVRDPKTRVGIGIAYVQFYDGNDVEAALLLDGKKFPPMLPRSLRVARAKDPRKTAGVSDRSKPGKRKSPGDQIDGQHRPKVTSEQKSMAGRAGKLFGRAGAARYGVGHERRKADQARESDFKSPEEIIFEGRRASTKDGLPGNLIGGKKSKVAKRGPKPTGKRAKRAGEWAKTKGHRG